MDFHKHGERGHGSIGAVGPADDESYFVVESFVTSAGHAVVDGCGDAASVFLDRASILMSSGIRLRCAWVHQRSSMVLVTAASRSPVNTQAGIPLNWWAY